MAEEEIIQHHIQLKEGDIGRYVLLPGDPGRCEQIAAQLGDPVQVAENREFNTYTGMLDGEKVAVVSTGIGSPSTAIAVEELIKIGADTFIRIGTAGGIQKNIKTGDLGIITSAIRDEGTGLQYMPVEFPAVADLEVVLALRQAAQDLALPFHVGPAHSTDSYYGDLETARMPLASWLAERKKAWAAGGAVCAEMESAILLLLAAIYGKRAGGVVLMVGENPSSNQMDWADMFDINRAIHTAIRGLRILIDQDRSV